MVWFSLSGDYLPALVRNGRDIFPKQILTLAAAEPYNLEWSEAYGEIPNARSMQFPSIGMCADPMSFPAPNMYT